MPTRSYKAGKILLDVSRIVSSSLELDRVVELVLKESTRALHADNAALFLYDEDVKHLLLIKARGFTGDEAGNIKLLGSWEVINDQLLKTRRPMIVNDVATNSVFRSKHLPFSDEKMPIRAFLAVPLMKDGRVVGSLIVSNRASHGHAFARRDEKLLVALAVHIAIALLNAKVYQDLKDLFIGMTKSFVRAIEAKDTYTSGHSERVMKYSVAIGKELRLGGDELENLRLSSLLHDVGKLGIKDSILCKPAKLTVHQRELIKQHTLIGKRIVEAIRDSKKIIHGIVEHHERFDGKGYPRGLKGSAISLQGRIVAVADVFDALTTTRPYQKKYTAKEALFEILNSASYHFDPKVVRAFIKSFSRHPDVWKT